MLKSVLSKSPVLRKGSSRKKTQERNSDLIIGNNISRPILNPDDRRRKEFYGTISLWLPERDQGVVENVVSCSSSSMLSLPSIDRSYGGRNYERELSSTTSLHTSYVPINDLLPSVGSQSNGDISNSDRKINKSSANITPDKIKDENYNDDNNTIINNVKKNGSVNTLGKSFYLIIKVHFSICF